MELAGALAYLKGHPDGIVTVLLTAIAAGAGAQVGPWFGIAILGVALLMYGVRQAASERYRLEMERLANDRAALELEEVKARFRAMLDTEQPSLPLGGGSNAKLAGVTHKGDQGTA